MKQSTTQGWFELPDELAAGEPPEARGIERDEVRLLVASRAVMQHVRFRNLGDFLAAGDVLVVNTSATLPAAVDGRRAGSSVVVHFSAPVGNGLWMIELRSDDGSRALLDAAPGEVVDLAAGAGAEVVATSGIEGRNRVVTASISVEGTVEDYLAHAGRPIAYPYVARRWPLATYQTVFATEPGSAEMPSAGRPFSTELVTSLIARGVVIVPVVLHTGVSSLERGEPPLPERVRVPPATARAVNSARAAGSRVVAVGTSVARALETAADGAGSVTAVAGWTDLVLGPGRPARIIDGLITGWHTPDASHQLLLQAVAGRELVHRAYRAALQERYLWHEFGDACLFLRDAADLKLLRVS
ncbi:MAG TPA: S-adenosylmethionine:tRNA ribosyltransferase-isomerase [Actinomycetota bacterium]|nr:S-adenosylmethionine:tRNA ribosyltransferase-isomerase [Actinomycetota bacterium]